MVTARQKVLAYLNKTRTASAREVSRALKMSAATVRHHLRVLVSDGRLEMMAVRGREGRGRPEKVYTIPRAALGDNLSVLSEALWTEAGKSVSVEALAKRLAGESDFKSQQILAGIGHFLAGISRIRTTTGRIDRLRRGKHA